MDSSIAGGPTPLTTRIVKYWLPVALILAAMYYFSTDVFSAENTRSVFEKIFLWFSPRAGHRALANFNYVMRKTAHFTEYAVLGAFLYRAFRAGDPTRWRFRWAFYAFATAASWSLLDELHQAFTRTRGGSVWDSLLDSSGAAFALILIAIMARVLTLRAANRT